MRTSKVLLAALIICTSLTSQAVNAADIEFVTSLKAELDSRAADGRFSGAVLVARNGKPFYAAAYGEGNRERKTPNTLETRFRLGSMGKMFTGVAIAQLAQAGKLRLEDALGKFLPDYPNKDVAKVTIHQLLTHTGGTGDIFGPQFMEHRRELKEIKDYVALFGARDTEFPAGSRHVYSNYGYVLLGRIIEVVSGQSYDAYVRDHIFIATGMKSTDNIAEDQHVAGLAVPYAGSRSAEDMLPYRGTSAGGGYSTVGDLLKFATALTTHKLLNAEYTALLLTGKVDTPRLGMRYAYGFEDATLPDGAHRVGHGGGAPGMNGTLSIFPATGHVIAVLANMDPPAAMDIDRFISMRLPH